MIQRPIRLVYRPLTMLPSLFRSLLRDSSRLLSMLGILLVPVIYLNVNTEMCRK